MAGGADSAAGAVPVLRFEGVGKSYPDGRRRIAVLERVSFEIVAGDHVGVRGARRSGKSTLLRLASGVEAPDAGTIAFEGRDVARMSPLGRDRLLRDAIALVSGNDWRPAKGERVVDVVALPLVSNGATLQEARRRARRILNRVDAGDYADFPASSLATGERMRVMLARALVREPRLLLVDEPAVAPSLTERAELYELMRSGARECGATLIVASEDSDAVRGVDVLMSIGSGEVVCAGGEPGIVVPFPARRSSGLERSGS
jgi:ABC-type lipoprotein export system ATPase subunit